jgi:hypothetical protein
MLARTILALSVLAPVAAAQGPALPVKEVPPAAEEPWEISGSVYYSDPPGTDDRVTPILYADRGSLHLEARYGYEDDDTASFWAGWTFETGEELTAAITPMLGAVVGNTDGFAPGLELDVGWRRISWYAEMEYLFDVHDHDDNFFYSWSTLTYGLTDWLSAGLVTERSKLVDTDYSLQRGLALEFHRAHLGFSLYAYDIGTDDSYTVFALEIGP